MSGKHEKYQESSKLKKLRKEVNKMKWSSLDVMNWCIEKQLYTNGDCRAYDRMLRFVSTHEPTDKNVELVAIDIVSHSDYYSIFEEGDVDYIVYELRTNVIK